MPSIPGAQTTVSTLTQELKAQRAALEYAREQFKTINVALSSYSQDKKNLKKIKERLKANAIAFKLKVFIKEGGNSLLLKEEFKQCDEQLWNSIESRCVQEAQKEKSDKTSPFMQAHKLAEDAYKTPTSEYKETVSRIKEDEVKKQKLETKVGMDNQKYAEVEKRQKDTAQRIKNIERRERELLKEIKKLETALVQAGEKSPTAQLIHVSFEKGASMEASQKAKSGVELQGAEVTYDAAIQSITNLQEAFVRLKRYQDQVLCQHDTVKQAVKQSDELVEQGNKDNNLRRQYDEYCQTWACIFLKSYEPKWHKGFKNAVQQLVVYDQYDTIRAKVKEKQAEREKKKMAQKAQPSVLNKLQDKVNNATTVNEPKKNAIWASKKADDELPLNGLLAELKDHYQNHEFQIKILKEKEGNRVKTYEACQSLRNNALLEDKKLQDDIKKLTGEEIPSLKIAAKPALAKLNIEFFPSSECLENVKESLKKAKSESLARAEQAREEEQRQSREKVQADHETAQAASDAEFINTWFRKIYLALKAAESPWFFIRWLRWLWNDNLANLDALATKEKWSPVQRNEHVEEYASIYSQSRTARALNLTLEHKKNIYQEKANLKEAKLEKASGSVADSKAVKSTTSNINVSLIRNDVSDISLFAKVREDGYKHSSLFSYTRYKTEDTRLKTIQGIKLAVKHSNSRSARVAAELFPELLPLRPGVKR